MDSPSSCAYSCQLGTHFGPPMACIRPIFPIQECMPTEPKPTSTPKK
jgi:hypothetical protein